MQVGIDVTCMHTSFGGRGSFGFGDTVHVLLPLFPSPRLCDEQLSNQSHYDFGLRALKSVLVSASNIKRERIQQLKQEL